MPTPHPLPQPKPLNEEEKESFKYTGPRPPADLNKRWKRKREEGIQRRQGRKVTWYHTKPVPPR